MRIMRTLAIACAAVGLAALGGCVDVRERKAADSFVRAVGVWPAGEREAVNAFFGFRGDFDAKAGGRSVLRIAASGAFRLFVNGAFAGYGPARGPVGHFRVDEWDLSPYVKDGPNALAIEAVNYGVQNFYLPYAPGFVQAEVLVDGRVALATAKDGGFGAVRLPKVRNTTRYTFQRGFAEFYKVGVKAWDWRVGGRGKSEKGGLVLEETPVVPLLPRRAPLPLFELKRPKIVGTTEAVFEPLPESALKTKGINFLEVIDSGISKGMYRGMPSSQAEMNVFRTVQGVRIGATKAVTSGTAAIGAGKGALADVGVNDTGFLGCVVDCRKPGRLIVTFDEVLTDGKVNPVRLSAGNGFVYDLLEPGRYRLETFEPYTMRYAHFCFADGEGDVSDVTFRTYKNAEAYAATFDSSDPALNRIFAAARETFAQNAVDVFTDCPSRERAGWLCDSFFTARVSKLLTGSVGLETLFLENFAIPGTFDVDEGMLPMCYPSDHANGNFIPNWAMWAVIEIDEYARRGGDPAMVAKLKPRLEKLVGFLWKFRNADGLLEKMPRWNFIEWSQANKWVQDVNYPSNMTWAEMLDCMDRLYGRPDLAAEAKRVRETIRRQSWTGTWFCDHAVRRPDGTLEIRKDDVTETCQYYAFFFKVATPETHPALWKTLVDEFGPKRYDPNDRRKMLAHPGIWPSNAFIGNYLRLELLARAGLAKNIVDETRGYFLYMADRTGTLWEHDTPARSSCNHGFASHAAVLLVRDVLGVREIDSVRRTVTLRAGAVPLARCSVTLPTPDGKMTLGWTRENGRCVWKNALPPGWTVAPDTRTYDECGLPVYDLAPFENYADTALTPARRAELLATLPGRLAAAEKGLDAAAVALKTAFAAVPDAVQSERAEKRMVMARRLCDYVRLNLGKGTVSGICQAENGVEGLEKFVAYFTEELAFWKTYPLAPGVGAKRFNLRDFGAKGDGTTDDEPAFRKAFAAIRNLKGAPSVLEIPAGEYLVNAKQTGTFPRPLLRFEKIVNCVLDGAGPEKTKIVYGNYDGDGMDFRDWENSALRGVQVYWKESPFVEGEVESVDRATGSLVLRHHANTLRPNDPRFARIGYANSCMQFDRNREPIRNPVLWYKYRCDDLGNGRYRMYFDPEYGSTKTMPIAPGSTLVFPDRSNAIAALRATSSRFFTFENVWIRNSRAGAFTPGPSCQTTVVRCRIFPKDPENCLSANADGNFTAAGACLMHCEFVNMNDDGVNSHHKGKIFHSYDAATGRYGHDSNWQWERPGDYVQVVSSMDGRYLLNTRVRSVEFSKETREKQLTSFADPLPANVRTYTSLGIAPYDALTRRRIYLGTMRTDKFPDQFYIPYTWGVGFVCTDNVFRNIRGVAIQIQCPNALVEGNLVENVYRGVEFSGLLHYQEGPPPYNVILRNNVFRSVNRGIKSTFMALNHPPAVTTPMGLLLIESNRVERAGERSLVLANAEDSIVRDNVFVASGGVDVNVCRGIVFSGNTSDGKPVDGSVVKSEHVREIRFE